MIYLGPYAYLQEGLGSAVGHTIIKQIQAQDKWAIGAWGAMGVGRILTYAKLEQAAAAVSQMMGGYKILDEKSNELIKNALRSSYGGLVLKVNGPKLKNGYVIINLNSSDTYTVLAGQVRSGMFNQKKLATGIYWDSLVEVINGIVG